MICSFVCKGQFTKDSSDIHFTGTIASPDSASFMTIKDSCWWNKKSDTIKTDFVIIVDENNFVKKERTDLIIHNYEIKDCQYSAVSFWNQNTKNDVYLLDGKPVEVLFIELKTSMAH